MAIGWFSVLKRVPWTAVISNAPVVADGAKKLWNAVASKTSPQAPPLAPEEAPQAQDEDVVTSLRARLAEVAAATSQFQAQMLASSELIKALAEQNAQLVQRIESHRVRILWLSAAAAVLAITTLLGLILVFSLHA